MGKTYITALGWVWLSLFWPSVVVAEASVDEVDGDEANQTSQI